MNATDKTPIAGFQDADDEAMLERYVDLVIQQIMDEEAGQISERELREKVEARVTAAWKPNVRGNG